MMIMILIETRGASIFACKFDPTTVCFSTHPSYSERKISTNKIRAEDNAPRYLAEQNINIITPADPPGELLGLAGKYFKRWDYTTRRFVSNIKHEYPDD